LIAIISTAMIASSTRSPSDRISAPSEILCSPMSNIHMPRKVAASTSGIDTATTSPVRRPRLTSETASTISTASASERTNWLTDRCTAAGMLATCTISTPTGSFSRRRPISASRSRPRWTTSPPAPIVMPSPSASRPCTRIFCCGGST